MTARFWVRSLPAGGGLVGDDLMRALLPVANDLVTAVHEDDREAVAVALDAAERLACDPVTAARHLAVLCAGMCSEDHAQAASLGWTLNPREYRRLKANVDCLTASLRAGRATNNDAA